VRPQRWIRNNRSSVDHSVRNDNDVRFDLPIASYAVNIINVIISVAEFRKQSLTPEQVSFELHQNNHSADDSENTFFSHLRGFPDIFNATISAGLRNVGNPLLCAVR